MCEKILDSENWKLEAEAVIRDIKDHVHCVQLSDVLKITNQHVYINLTTLESVDYCVELSGNGFRIVGKNYNVTNEESDAYFETPYSLLNKISPRFNDSFGNALMDKLKTLAEN